MKKSAITFKEGTPEYVVMHARWQKSRGRNPSLPYGDERNPRKALEKATEASLIIPARCGCGGEIVLHSGCLKYLCSDFFDAEVAHEGLMRHGGLGFGVDVDSGDAMMSMHLQGEGGLSHEATDAVLRPSWFPKAIFQPA